MLNECWLQQECKRAGHCPDPFCIKKYKIDFLSDKALLSQKQRVKQKLYLDESGADRNNYAFLSDVEKSIEDFVKNGNNLFIYSEVTGNGKTAWATRLLNSYISNIWATSKLECRALFVHVPKFFQSIKNDLNEKDEYAQYVRDNITKADLVVFDELANKSITTFEADSLLSIISRRIDKGLSNIYTSNLGGKELQLTIGDRLYSRIVNTSTVLRFMEQDKRGIKV